MGRQRNSNETGFGLVGVLVVLLCVSVIAFAGVYVVHNRSNNKTAASTTPVPKAYTPQEATAFVQKTYDDYLAALKKANSDPSNTQPVAQVGLEVVKDSLAADLYKKAAAVTQATPFSCTAQYVTDKYTASLVSSNKANAVVAVSISNGGGFHGDAITATVDLTSLKITSVVCLQ